MKWFGKIAFGEEVWTSPDVVEVRPVEYDYFGDLLRSYRTTRYDDTINPNMTLSNQLSVIMDERIMTNFHNILYVTFGGAKWTISNIEFNPPRAVLTFGEIYKEDSDAEVRSSIADPAQDL